MSTQPFDSEGYKARQKQEWGAAAEGWRRRWDSLERNFQPVSHRLVAMGGVREGHRVLDVATGIGEPAVTAAGLIGSQGLVVATDQAPEMLAIARDRAADLGLRNIEFREMDAEALDLPEGTFNAVLCRFGLMFLPDLDGALDTFRRLLVPGGRLAAAVWGETAKVPMIPLLHSVAQRELTIPPAPPGTPTVFSLADQGRLERALLGAGFTAVQSEAVAVNAEWPSRRDYVQFAQDISAALKGLLERYPAEKWEAVWQAIGDAAAEYAGSDGTVRMANEAICVVGQR